MTNSNYGFILIDTEEKRRACEPKLPTDEVMSFKCNWSTNIQLNERFNPDFTYRRLIPPGEGREMVKEEEARGFDGKFLSGIECTSDGVHWSPYLYPDWLMVETEKVIAFRRRITKSATPPSDWQPIRKDGELDLPTVFPVEVCDWLTGKQGVSDFVRMDNQRLAVAGWTYQEELKITHWKPLALSAPPIPPPADKTVAERCLEEWLLASRTDRTGLVSEVIQFTIDFLEKEVK